MEDDGWEYLELEETIDLKKTLFSGQVFSFKQTDRNEYTGHVSDHLISFYQENDRVKYKVIVKGQLKDPLSAIEDFFSLKINLKNLFKHWNIDIPSFLIGLRPIKNDLIPTIFSFICSSCNNVSRIAKMVEYLYSKGNFLINYKNVNFYSFPELEVLCEIEEELKEKKFGYRANYICEGAKYLIKNFNNLENKSYADIKNNLMCIKGIGTKVADCICLIGMGHFDVVPIDTHIFNYSNKEFDLKIKSLDKKTYKMIQDIYKTKYGEYAGIAQLYIFKSMLDTKKSRKSKTRVTINQ